MSTSRAKKKQRRRAAASGSRPTPADPAGGGDTARAGAQSREVAAQRQRAAPRPSRFELRDGVPRPQPLWAPFPLTEIGMAAGIAIFGAGLLSDGGRAQWLLTVAVLMLAVVVGELCLREHFAGFRSHTLLLAVLGVAILNGLAVAVFGDAVRGPPVLGLDLALAGGLAWLLIRRFRSAHERAARAAEA